MSGESWLPRNRTNRTLVNLGGQIEGRFLPRGDKTFAQCLIRGRSLAMSELVFVSCRARVASGYGAEQLQFQAKRARTTWLETMARD